MISFWRQLAFLLLLVSWLPGCRCSRADVIAELVASKGTVERDWANRLRQWQVAELGSKYRLGDGIRAGGESTAELSLQGDARLTLTPNSMVRFLPNGEEGFIALDVELGEALLETRTQRIRVLSSFGRVVIEPETKMAMVKSAEGVRFAVALGKVSFTNDEGEEKQITAGKGIQVAVGGAIIEEFAAIDDDPPPAKPPEPNPIEEESKKDIIAKTTGDGAHQRAPGASEWQHLPEGQTKLEAGTGVKVEAGTTVELNRGQQQVVLGEGEFVVGAPGGYLVQAAKGPVKLSSLGASVKVPGGTIIAKDADTAADVSIGNEESEVRVHLGRVEIQGQTTEEVRGGETGVVKRDGKVTVSGRGPSPVDLVVDAGATFTVHDPRPPTAIGFTLGGKCERGAIVQLGKLRYSGDASQTSAPFPPGTYRYQIRCLTRTGPEDSPAATGTVTVVHDAGTRPITKTAPATHVNTDGRRYTVLYQSRLPQISVGWATAPEASSYTLVVTGGASRTLKTSSPSYSFASGALTEGTHQLYFEAASDPPRRSRTTTVAIRFDNATPTASIAGPVDLPAGEEVGLRGTALPGWSVWIGSRELPLDTQQRFATEITMPKDGALPVRFEHPTRGVHYYLRRTKP